MNISKMLANSVKTYGEEFVAEQTALRSEQSRQKSIAAYHAFTQAKKFKDGNVERTSKKKADLVHA